MHVSLYLFALFPFVNVFYEEVKNSTLLTYLENKLTCVHSQQSYPTPPMQAFCRLQYPTNIGIAMGTASVATIVVVSAGVDI